MLGCAAQDFAAEQHFAAMLPTAVDWQWHFAAMQLRWPGFAVSADAVVALAAAAVDSAAEVVAAGPTVGCAVGGQPGKKMTIPSEIFDFPYGNP